MRQRETGFSHATLIPNRLRSIPPPGCVRTPSMQVRNTNIIKKQIKMSQTNQLSMMKDVANFYYEMLEIVDSTPVDAIPETSPHDIFEEGVRSWCPVNPAHLYPNSQGVGSAVEEPKKPNKYKRVYSYLAKKLRNLFNLVSSR